MDIIKEAEKIANRYELKRPKEINITEADWRVASEETRDLLLQINPLEKPLDSAYWEAVDRENWLRALLIYQRLTHTPYLFSINPILHDSQERGEREKEFIAQAREWLIDVRGLLSY